LASMIGTVTMAPTWSPRRCIVTVASMGASHMSTVVHEPIHQHLCRLSSTMVFSPQLQGTTPQSSSVDTVLSLWCFGHHHPSTLEASPRCFGRQMVHGLGKPDLCFKTGGFARTKIYWSDKSQSCCDPSIRLTVLKTPLLKVVLMHMSWRPETPSKMPFLLKTNRCGVGRERHGQPMVILGKST
jgi:hypothetical protein